MARTVSEVLSTRGDVPDVSVSIVSYNTADTLDRGLEALRASRGVSFEVIVVDNGSADGSAEMLRHRHPWVRLIANSENRFFTAAHNQALGVSRGRYVLIMNSDVLVAPDTLLGLVRFLDAHPGAGAVACRLLKADGGTERNCWRFDTVASVLLEHRLGKAIVRRSRTRQHHRMEDWNPDLDCQVEVVSDAFVAVRREALDQIGGYDERYLLYYTEDDLCLRLARSGWPVFYHAGVHATHIGQVTSRRVGMWRIWWWRRRDAVVFFRKHHGLAASAVINAFWTVDIVVRVPLKKLLGRW